ncbi:MAG: exodeoxyribonuclease III [Treponema sp.]|nr:exodeoxyribonuclease III [Treponema sp.]
MRIISWNVNGIRAAEKHGFSQWLERESPDALCLNETKAEPAQLPAALALPRAGGQEYHGFWACAKKRGYSGVAIFSKKAPLETRYFGIPEFDDEGRVAIAEFEAFTLIAAYFPNSQDGGKRLDYKLAFCGAMLKFCDDLAARGRHFVLCGDYNIAHRPIDLARPKQNENSPGYFPEERAWMSEFLDAGHVDTFRHFNPELKDSYTWWSYRSEARERNVGWRIDYHCVDAAFLPKVKSSLIRPDVHGSDHCPVEITLDLKA